MFLSAYFRVFVACYLLTEQFIIPISITSDFSLIIIYFYVKVIVSLNIYHKWDS